MNWINNRGYSVSCDVTLKCEVIKSVLKTSAGSLVELNTSKNFVGSSLAGCIGLFHNFVSFLLAKNYQQLLYCTVHYVYQQFIYF